MALVSRQTRQVAVETLVWDTGIAIHFMPKARIRLWSFIQKCDRLLNLQTMKGTAEATMQDFVLHTKGMYDAGKK